MPLVAEGRSFGALGLSFREPIIVRPEDRELLLAVARQCAQAVRRATLFDAEGVARASAEASGRRLAFLAEASAALASLDYEATLQHVAQLAVPSFADYVVIDLLDESRRNAPGGVSARRSDKAELLRATARYYPARQQCAATRFAERSTHVSRCSSPSSTTRGCSAQRDLRSISPMCARSIRTR